MIKRTVFMCWEESSRKKGKFEKKKKETRERERENIAGAVSMGRQDRMRSGAEVWVGWVHTLVCKELNMVLSIY